jgi:type II restriction/modification system DNA methylase subunit YeeA
VPPRPTGRAPAIATARDAYLQFRERLGRFRVLDPACGSGNFLYLSLWHLKDFDLRVMNEAKRLDMPPDDQRVTPQTVLGIEINEYAAELARVTIWIGELQWQRDNSFGFNRSPILGALHGIECRDALINADGTEAEWPPADAIVSNPPFLGDKRMIGDLGEEYVTKLRNRFAGRVPGGADLVTYWFEKARLAMQNVPVMRAGLVATNSIRGGANRKVLDRICAFGAIIEAWRRTLGSGWRSGASVIGLIRGFECVRRYSLQVRRRFCSYNS